MIFVIKLTQTKKKKFYRILYVSYYYFFFCRICKIWDTTLKIMTVFIQI